MKSSRIRKYSAIVALFSAVGIIAGAQFASAASDVTINQSITGVLDVAIVDESGNVVDSPSADLSTVPFSMTQQTSTGTLGTSSERMRVTNPTSTATWSLGLAATDGNTAKWTGPTRNYDFNNASDAQGKLTVNPGAGNIAGVMGTSTDGVSLGSSSSFEKDSVDSITLMSASASAVSPGQWDLTGVGLSQTIPAGQAAESYSISMTLTAV